MSDITNETPVISKESAFYFAQMFCLAGAGIEGVGFACDAVGVPAKLVSGGYFKRSIEF